MVTEMGAEGIGQERKQVEAERHNGLGFLVLVKPTVRSMLGMECSFETCFAQHPLLLVSTSPFPLPHSPCPTFVNFVLQKSSKNE